MLVANIQMNTLKTEVEKGTTWKSNWTFVVIVTPKRYKGNSVRKQVFVFFKKTNIGVLGCYFIRGGGGDTGNDKPNL